MLLSSVQYSINSSLDDEPTLVTIADSNSCNLQEHTVLSGAERDV